MVMRSNSHVNIHDIEVLYSTNLCLQLLYTLVYTSLPYRPTAYTVQHDSPSRSIINDNATFVNFCAAHLPVRLYRDEILIFLIFYMVVNN